MLSGDIQATQTYADSRLLQSIGTLYGAKDWQQYSQTSAGGRIAAFNSIPTNSTPAAYFNAAQLAVKHP